MFKNTNNNKSLLLTLIVVIVVSVLSFKGIQGITTGLVTDISKKISKQYSEGLNEQMSSHLSNSFNYRFGQIDMLYNSLSLIDDLSEEKLCQFIQNIEDKNEISYLAFADENGMVYEGNGSFLGTMRIKMLGSLLNGDKHVVSDNATIGNESYILFGSSFDKPVRMGDKLICASIIGLSNNDLSEEIVLSSDISGGFSSIINKDGSYVVKNSLEPFSGLNAYTILDKNYRGIEINLSDIKKAINNNESIAVYATAEGDDTFSLLYFAPITDTEWYAVNTLPGTFIKTNVDDLQSGLAKISTLGMTLVAAVIAMLLLNRSKKSLQKKQVELEKAYKQAEEANKAKTTFLFNMSHDIRTPLNAVTGFNNMAMKNIDNKEKVMDCLEKSQRAGNMLLSLINNVLEVSRIESGQVILKDQPGDVYYSFANIEQTLIEMAEAKNIDLTFEVNDVKDRYVYCDYSKCTRILVNVISNAIKYTNDGGYVKVRCKQLDYNKEGYGLYQYTVEDNGIGMSEEFQEKVFEQFSRENTSTVSGIQGTGLGMAVVKSFVEMMGGEVSVQSKLNEGTTFTVKIPFKLQEGNQYINPQTGEVVNADEVIETREAIDFKGKRILLVEDNELNREIASDLLTEEGFIIEEAEDGSLAVDILKDRGPEYYDFILMDIQMPIMNGYEATKAIREMYPNKHIPIIALSANAFAEDKEASAKAGMDDHVAKPINVDELFKSLARFIK
ncbi:MAG: response regulator [Erysipelotrichaceae bacterium]|nr:response regulator [Erysipelotrichaceae bacterium]